MDFKGIIREEVLEKLYSFCAYQERCTADVERKLRSLEIKEQYWVDYINHLRQEKFLDDARFCEYYVKGKINGNKWGKKKVEFHLRKKGLSSNTIEQALESIDQENYQKIANCIASKKWNSLKEPNEYKRKQKLYQFMTGRGFESFVIQNALDELQ